MNQKLPLALAISTALALFAAYAPAYAQGAEAAATERADEAATVEEAEQLDTITVTGSRIPRAQVEGPAPVVTITADDIQREGFNTVSDALQTLTQQTSAGIQTEFDAGSFTQNASAIDLRGLGTGRVLVLFNGRRAADYPLPFNGQSNIVNLSAIPAAAVERIEVLSGGASAIYGSDAIAGVINVVMKDNFDGHTLSYRWGDTSDGGGQSNRVQAVGGFSGERWRMVYAYEYLKRDPIWAYQRDFMDSIQDNPDESLRFNTRNVLVVNPFAPLAAAGGRYVSFDQNLCNQWSEFEASSRPRYGTYCGRDDDLAQFTIRNEDDNHSLYTRGSFDLGDGGELWAQLNYWTADSEYNTGTPAWYSNFNNPVIVDAGLAPSNGFTRGAPRQLQRIYSATEMGGREANNQLFDENLLDVAFGWKTYLFDDYGFELTYSRQKYELERDRRLFLNDAIDAFYLGQPIGEEDGYPVYDVRNDRFFRPLTPAEFNQLTGIDHTEAESQNQLFQAVLNGDLFDLPAGPVQFAMVAEAGSQEYDINLDPRLLAGDWFAYTGTEGGGERDRYALGAEFAVPLHETLTAKVAGRYDKYDDVTDVDDAATYNFGLEWRPIDSLLVRGTYATSFRAPDMHYVFADASGYFTTVTDEYLCRTLEPGTPFPDCEYANESISGARQGNPALKEEEGESYTIGFVWDVMDEMSVSVDYYNIEVEDIVQDLNTTNLLQTEADCRIGRTEGGVAVDVSSAECQDAIARIERFPNDGSNLANRIDRITVGPINTASQETDGIDATFRWTLPWERFGRFRTELGYTHVLSQDVVEFEGDPVQNQRDNLQYFGFRSNVRGSVTWEIGDFTTTLFGQRRGSLPNWAETGRIGPYITYNASLQYRFDDHWTFSGIVNNIGNRAPNRDETFDVYPYFISNYDPVGREYFFQVDYRF